MPLTVVPEEDIASKSRKTKKEEKIDSAKTKITGGILKEEVSERKKEEVGERKIPKVFPEPPTQGNMPPGINLVIKRIYFPGDTYSKYQVEFKKILADHGLTWAKSMYKTYLNSKTGMKMISGGYSTVDQNKKIFAIYEGSNKPMTAIVKILGTGGVFLIELQGFCHKVGCTFEDKDENYINNVLLTLQERGEIYVEKKLTETDLDAFKKEFDEKVKKYTDEILERWMDAYRDTLIKRGLTPEIIAKFRRMEIEDEVKSALANGLIEGEKDWSEKYEIIKKGEKETENKIEIKREEKIEIKKEEGEKVGEIKGNELKERFYKEFEGFIRTNLAKSKRKYTGAQIGSIVEFARQIGLPIEDGVRGVEKFVEELVVRFKSIGIPSKIKDDYIYFEKT